MDFGISEATTRFRDEVRALIATECTDEVRRRQIGWLPYVLERADDVWLQHRAWAGVRDTVPEPPSTYYYQSVYGCFFRDQHGIASLRWSARTT